VVGFVHFSCFNVLTSRSSKEDSKSSRDFVPWSDGDISTIGEVVVDDSRRLLKLLVLVLMPALGKDLDHADQDSADDDARTDICNLRNGAGQRASDLEARLTSNPIIIMVKGSFRQMFDMRR
jgi:hypothetical protein